MSMFDSTLRKNGQLRCISRSSSILPCPHSTHASTAEPKPYHPGSIRRHWLQLNTHGIARRSSIDCAGRLREHRFVARPAAAADGAAAAVEQAQPHAARVALYEQRLGRLVERPVRGEIAAVLVAVGIAEHHLLLVAAPGDPAAVK